MDCPRCKVPLTVVSTVVEARICDECEGVWLSGEALSRCLTLEKGYLRNSPLAATLEADHPQVALDPMVNCPDCGQQMRRSPYDEKECSVVVDSCPAHGIWLDDGELAKIHEYRQAHPEASKKDKVAVVPRGVWQGLASWFHRPKATAT